MKRINTLVVGGGQAGLAMSHALGELAIDHVVIERGRVGERWRAERWDSLRLLTPNWQSRLPGYAYTGPDPDGYMTMAEVIAFLEGYARRFAVPVEEHTRVLSVAPRDGGFHVVTTRGEWQAANVVVASGYCDIPHVPPMAVAVSSRILQLVPTRYRRPSDLPEGGVLVVGASASGVQLADELQASGRQVTLAVGRHTRLPRRYRDRDILWWFDRMGIFDETIDDVFDVEISRRQPSLQLVGRPDHATLDLPTLQSRGVQLTGRLMGLDGRTAWFDDELVAYTAASDVRLARLLARVDEHVEREGLEREVGPPEPFQPFLWPSPEPGWIDLEAAGIRTIVWATGFRRSYPWLRVPVLDAQGELRHRGGVIDWPGLYAMGLNFMRRRKSTFIDGVGADARDLAAHLAARQGLDVSRMRLAPLESAHARS
jgi:putative flavoprotein involved in K+ transport